MTASMTKIPFDFFGQALQIPATRIYGAAALLKAGDMDGITAKPEIVAIVMLYTHLLKYAQPEIALVITQRAVIACPEGLEGIAVVNKVAAVVNNDKVWELATGRPAEPTELPTICEQHGLDLVECAKQIITAASDYLAQQEKRRQPPGPRAGAPHPFGAAPAGPAAPAAGP